MPTFLCFDPTNGFFTRTACLICFLTLILLRLKLITPQIAKMFLPLTFGVLVVGTTLTHVYWEKFKEIHYPSSTKMQAVLCDILLHWLPFILLYRSVKNAPWSKFGFPVAAVLPLVQYRFNLENIQIRYEGMPLKIMLPLYVLAISYANVKF